MYIPLPHHIPLSALAVALALTCVPATAAQPIDDFFKAEAQTNRPPSHDRPNGVAQGLPPGAIPIDSPRRVLPIKPANTILSPNAVPGQVIVKFRDEALVRLRGKDLAGLHRDMAYANRLLQMRNVEVLRLMSASEAAVETSQANAKGRGGNAALADLNAFYLLKLPTDSRTDQANLIDALNQLDVVELAYPLGRTESNWVTAPPPETSVASYVADQRYLDAAPWGVDARSAWDRGLKGAGVRLLDVELNGWNDQHEDIRFDINYLKGGVNTPSETTPADVASHGTAVAGTIAGIHNAYGVSGLAPDVELGLVSLNPSLSSKNGNFGFF